RRCGVSGINALNLASWLDSRCGGWLSYRHRHHCGSVSRVNQLDDICDRFDRPMQFLEGGAELGETKELGVCVGAFFEAFHMAENGVVRGNRD
ncbi:hypothetical protein, partial [Staphylococcus gallinarum]|uniref:hypothetical protein n=1 Tax=Staphylococcus gallinarum TaxID=1293 RepID=UPI003176CB23